MAAYRQTRTGDAAIRTASDAQYSCNTMSTTTSCSNYSFIAVAGGIPNSDLSDGDNTTCTFRDIENQNTTINKLKYEYEPDAKEMSTSPQKVSPTKSFSTSLCRYCYLDIRKQSSVSQCHCNGSLCKDCLVNEIILTYNRPENKIQCTVCKSDYKVSTDFHWDCSTDFKSFFIDHTLYCGLNNEQFLLNNCAGKFGFGLVLLGVSIWIISTSLLFAFPPSGIQIYLFYMVAGFDSAVGAAALWFLIKCRWLAAFFISFLYLLRCVYLLLGYIINLFNINIYQSEYINVLAYFIVVSFIAFIVLTVCWILELSDQYLKYKINHRRFTLNGTSIKIDFDKE